MMRMFDLFCINYIDFSLHNREFISVIFSSNKNAENLFRELYHRSKILFDSVAPLEYGITWHEKFEIGSLNSELLLQKIVSDLQDACLCRPCTRLFFTKESHVHTLYNVIYHVFELNLPRAQELDYL